MCAPFCKWCSCCGWIHRKWHNICSGRYNLRQQYKATGIFSDHNIRFQYIWLVKCLTLFLVKFWILDSEISIIICFFLIKKMASMDLVPVVNHSFLPPSSLFSTVCSDCCMNSYTLQFFVPYGPRFSYVPWLVDNPTTKDIRRTYVPIFWYS